MLKNLIGIIYHVSDSNLYYDALKKNLKDDRSPVPLFSNNRHCLHNYFYKGFGTILI